jgi:osmotically-inducible protein OsmY
MPEYIPDKSILLGVNRQLGRIGRGSQNRITAEVKSGDVTLGGFLQYEHQRRNITRAVSTVPGVRRVIDKMQVLPHKSKWG